MATESEAHSVAVPMFVWKSQEVDRLAASAQGRIDFMRMRPERNGSKGAAKTRTQKESVENLSSVGRYVDKDDKSKM